MNRMLVIAALIWAGANAANAAEPTEETRRLAAEVPIADVHLHVSPGLTPEEMLNRMNRTGVRWGGAVGPIAANALPASHFKDVLGDRYIAMAGQPEFTTVYRSGGVAALADPNHSGFRALFAQVEADLAAKRIGGFGELIVNNRASNFDATFRRKMPLNAPSMQAIFKIANDHKAVVALHSHADNDSVAELEQLLAAFPNVSVMLSHCLAEGQPPLLRSLMNKHPKLFCELAGRFPPINPQHWTPAFTAHSADAGWIGLIEQFPDRIMVGSDLLSNASYDAIISTIRTGLLPRLPPPVLRKVAYENAQRLFDLK